MTTTPTHNRRRCRSHQRPHHSHRATDSRAGHVRPEHEQAAYRPAQAARRMGISRSQLYEELAAGRIKACKHGRATLILAAEIDRWLAQLPTWQPRDTQQLNPPPGQP